MLLIQDLPNSLGDPAELRCIFIYVAALPPPLPGPPLPPSPPLPSVSSLPPSSVCLPPSSSMHYSFIILLQLPYRPHFGEDKTCHLRVESGEMMGGFKEEEGWGRRGRRDGGCRECLPPTPPPPPPHYFPLSEMDHSLSLSFCHSFFILSHLAPFSLSLLPLPCPSPSLALAAVSLCNENLFLIEGAAASRPRGRRG